MRRELETDIAAAVQGLFNVQIDIELTRPHEQFGDYATNVALRLAKQVGKNPRDIAEALASKLRESLAEQVSEVSIAGPGFLNLTLTDQALWQYLNAVPGRALAGKSVVTEYSDPNPFKVLHAGHLYTTIVGDAVSNLLAAAGGTVHRLNFGGDVGLHVGKTMWAITRQLGGELPEKLAAVAVDSRLEWLSERYVAGNIAYDDDPQAKEAIIACNKRVYQLYEQDDRTSAFAQIYWTCRDWSYKGFEHLYEQLQVTPFERYLPESEVQVTGTKIVQDGLEKGIFVKSQGAVIYEGEKDGLHARVFLNSQGLPTYEAKDLGLAATKWQDYQFDLNVIITANDIVEYMKVVLKALGHFYPEAAERTKHLTHGVIKLAGGVKMSSRKGNVLRAEDVLIAAREAQVTATGEANELAVLAAVKYAFLKQRTGSDIVYDPEESVSILGNSGPYLQYAHARACSILARASESPHGSGDQLRSAAHVPEVRSAAVLADHPEPHGATEALNGGSLETDERSLVRKIGEYAEVVDRAVSELMPHHMCTYLYELAQTFNRFYEHNRVIDDPREQLRLNLVRAYAQTLKSGLKLLGIPAPDKL